MTSFRKLTLLADVPQELPGRFSAIRVIEGAHHAYYMFGENPGTSGDVTKARRLNYNGIIITGPIKDPWFLAKGQTPASTVPQLHLELFTGPSAMVEVGTEDLIHERIVAHDEAILVLSSTETTIATNGLDVGGIGVGDTEFHHRGYFGGFVRASGSFRLELHAKDQTGNWTVLAAAKSNNHTSHHGLMIDQAEWDFGWQKATPTAYGIGTVNRIALPPAIQSRIVFVEMSGASNTYTAVVSIKSR